MVSVMSGNPLPVITNLHVRCFAGGARVEWPYLASGMGSAAGNSPKHHRGRVFWSPHLHPALDRAQEAVGVFAPLGLLEAFKQFAACTPRLGLVIAKAPSRAGVCRAPRQRSVETKGPKSSTDTGTVLHA